MSYTVTITGDTATEQPVIDALTTAVAALPGTIDSATFVGADGKTVSLIPVNPIRELEDDTRDLGDALGKMDPADPNVQLALAAAGKIEADIDLLDSTDPFPPAGTLAPGAPVSHVLDAFGPVDPGLAVLPNNPTEPTQVTDADGVVTHAVAL